MIPETDCFHGILSIQWEILRLGREGIDMLVPTSFCNISNVELSTSFSSTSNLELSAYPWNPQYNRAAGPSQQEACTAYCPHPSEGRQNETHNHRKLTKMIPFITTLHNLMKLWAIRVGPPKTMGHGGEFWQNVVHWRREWQHFSRLALRTQWTVWKGKKITLKDEPPRSVSIQYATGEEWRIAPEGMKKLSQSAKYSQLWMCLEVKVNSDAVKNSTA